MRLTGVTSDDLIKVVEGPTGTPHQSPGVEHEVTVVDFANSISGMTQIAEGAATVGDLVVVSAVGSPNTYEHVDPETVFNVTPLTTGVGLKVTGANLTLDRGFVRLTADITSLVNNSTTLVDVTGMSLPVEASAVYELRGVIIYSADATADVKLGFSVPSGTVGQWSALAMHNTATVNTNTSARWQTQSDYSETEQLGAVGTGITSEATRSFALFQGLVVTSSTAGNFVMRAAQQTAHASAVAIGAGTYMRLDRVA